jgi:hypothetical protein
MTRKLKHKVIKGGTKGNKKDAMEKASKHGAQLFAAICTN